MSYQPPGTGNDVDEDVSPAIRKLNKINLALMQRVERSMDQQANAFSLFQTAIGLEAQVRHRTDELHNALSKLELANAELSLAETDIDRRLAVIVRIAGPQRSGLLRRAE